MKKLLISLLSLLLTFSLLMPIVAEDNQSDLSTTDSQTSEQTKPEEPSNGGIDWQEGMTVEYNGEQYKTLHYALIAVREDNLGADETAEINCKPEANVGGLHHAHVSNNLVINGNDAYVSDDKVPWISWMPNDSEHDISIEVGKDNVTYPLNHNINIEINQLDGIAIWGGRVSEYVVNIELNDCQNMHKVMLPTITNCVDGETNITLDDCSFKNSEDPNDYGLDFASIRSNYSGTISVTSTTFEGIHNPIDASNKFENGHQEIIVKNSTFTNCGTGGVIGNDDTTQIAAPIRVTNVGSGSTSSLTVENCEFLGDNERINGDILLGDGSFDASDDQGIIKASIKGTKANVVRQQKGYYTDETGDSVDETKQKTTTITADQTFDYDGINEPQIGPSNPRPEKPSKPNHNWVYRPSYNDSKDEEVKEYTTEDKTKACIELLGKGWEYSDSNKSCVYTLDSNTQQIPNTSTK